MSDKPQILPTEKVRATFEGALRLLDRVPAVSSFSRPRQSVTSSEVPVSIVIPLHPKDMWIAPYCLKFALKNLRHPVAAVYIVSRKSSEVQAWAEREGLEWLDEEKLLDGIKRPSDIVLPERASGLESWVFQQLLKFAVDDFVTSECFLILDSDTLLLAPRVFKSNDELWMDYSHERNLLYLKGYESLLGQSPARFRSFVCHHMFGEKSILRKLKGEIEAFTKSSWEQAILDLVFSEIWTEKEKSFRPFNFFSEYETYGNYCQSHYSKLHFSYFRNHGAKEYDPTKMTPEEYVALLPSYFKWASFHSYYEYEGLEKLEK